MSEVSIANIFPWLHEASNPYWDWLWRSAAQTQLNDWLYRPNSELSERRVRYLIDGDDIVGSYISMPGSELQICRRADLIALTNYLRRNPDEGMMIRIRQAQSLFAGVGENNKFEFEPNLCSTFRPRSKNRAAAFGHVSS